MKKAVSSKKTQDEYAVVLKDLRSQFHVFGEGLSYISDTADKHTIAFKKIDIRLQEIELQLKEMDFIKGELALIRHNQVTRDEFRFLETRVARLERTKK